jgi:hypothetical protein
MKKIIIVFAAVVLVTTANAQTGVSTYTHAAMATGAFPTRLSDNSILLRFSDKGIAFKVFYSPSGEWMHSVLSYDKSALLPADVRASITKAFPGLAVSYVDEVQRPDESPVYRIQLQDDKRLVIVKVQEGEMETETALRK